MININNKNKNIKQRNNFINKYKYLFYNIITKSKNYIILQIKNNNSFFLFILYFLIFKITFNIIINNILNNNNYLRYRKYILY